jgi:hypothetical protein
VKTGGLFFLSVPFPPVTISHCDLLQVHILPKHQYLSSKLHGVTTTKTLILMINIEGNKEIFSYSNGFRRMALHL